MLAVPSTCSSVDDHVAPTTFTLSGRRLLLATDGSPASAAAIHVADALAREHDAEVHVLHVADTRPGTPARAIVQETQSIEAALIVLGLRRHGRLDRALHDETTLSVVRSARCPVLAVATGTTGVPKRVLAAMDFSPSSMDAARVARAIMRPGGTMVLAHVPPSVRSDPRDGEREIRELGVQAAFSKFAHELAGNGPAIDHVVLHREMDYSIAELLLDYADGAQMDMICVGSMGQGRLERWLLGSVSTDLVRNGRHTVLVVPPRWRGTAIGE